MSTATINLISSMPVRDFAGLAGISLEELAARLLGHGSGSIEKPSPPKREQTLTAQIVDMHVQPTESWKVCRALTEKGYDRNVISASIAQAYRRGYLRRIRKGVYQCTGKRP